MSSHHLTTPCALFLLFFLFIMSLLFKCFIQIVNSPIWKEMDKVKVNAFCSISQVVSMLIWGRGGLGWWKIDVINGHRNAFVEYLMTYEQSSEVWSLSEKQLPVWKWAVNFLSLQMTKTYIFFFSVCHMLLWHELQCNCHIFYFPVQSVRLYFSLFWFFFFIYFPLFKPCSWCPFTLS